MAAIHPNIAFVVDIRRQNMIEHLLYKAIFELSPNRQEFLSRLFARKIDTALSRNAAPADLFRFLGAAPMDDSFYRESLQTVKDLLVVKHGFELSDDDKTTLEHVYEEFARSGVETRYTVQLMQLGTGGLCSLARSELSPDDVRSLPVIQAADG
jgi:hypothetical protein